jgi:hypothetical protein
VAPFRTLTSVSHKDEGEEEEEEKSEEQQEQKSAKGKPTRPSSVYRLRYFEFLIYDQPLPIVPYKDFEILSL